MFRSTNDKILLALIANQDKPLTDMLMAAKSVDPSLPDYKFQSAISELSKQDLISVIYADNTVAELTVQPYALARIDEKYERTINDRKWDVCKIALGYALGFISSLILTFVRG